LAGRLGAISATQAVMVPLSHLSYIYSYQPYGLYEPAVLWMIVVSTLMYAGPATVALFYLYAHWRREERAQILPFRTRAATREEKKKAA
jgi:hypothetical protein